MRSLVIVAALALLVSACTTLSNPMSPEQVSSFRLQGVDVTVAPNAFVSWPGGVPASMRNQTAADPQVFEVQTRQLIVTKLRDALLEKAGASLTGARPVRIQMRVDEFVIVPSVVRALIGGEHRLKADVTLVDAKTGVSLLAYPAQATAIGGGGGVIGFAVDNLVLDDPADRLVKQYVQQYSNWLLHK